MNFEDLSPELQEKARACKTPEEFMQLANDEGFDLTDEQLEAIAGGGDFWEFFFKLLGSCNLLGH